ncbi:hypothetical protein ACHAWF_006814 [Thalassiosira exigua]
MAFARKSKRTRNTSNAAGVSPVCGIWVDGDQSQSSAYPAKPSHRAPQHQQQQRRGLGKTHSTCTATTAATSTSSRSLYSTEHSLSEKDLCPVTGVYANIADDYRVSSRVIGKGHYGVVRECVHRATRQEFAVKSVEKARIDRLDHLQREIFLLANLDHRGVMKLVDCYEDATHVHLITEKYAGGELFDRIAANANSSGCFSERRTAAIVGQVLDAVAHLHDNDIVHRDIKPENVLFESKEDDAPVRLIDFGLSRRHERGEEPMTNPVGTAYYMAPELLKGRYDKACDVWAVGVVAYVLLSGYPPFNGANDAKIQESTRQGKLRFRGAQWLTKSDDAMDFVKCLLRRDPRKRLTASEALTHPWIRKMMS